MIFEASKCTEETWKHLYDDPVACESNVDINDWLAENKKRMYIHVLNDKLNF